MYKTEKMWYNIGVDNAATVQKRRYVFMRKKFISVTGLIMSAVLALSSAACVSAAEVDVQPSKETGIIKFDKGNWNKEHSVCFYIWASKPGERDLYWVQGQWQEDAKWASKKIIADDCEDPQYCEMEVDIMEGWNTFIIFNDYETTEQTFDCVITPSAFGDTAHMSDKLFENPEDSEKTCIGVYFDNADDCGSHLVITSTGNVVGSVPAPNDNPEWLVASALYKLIYKLDKNGEECCTQEKVNNWITSFGTTKEAVWEEFKTFEDDEYYEDYDVKVEGVKALLGIEEDTSKKGKIFFELGTEKCAWGDEPNEEYIWNRGDIISFFIWDATNGTYCTSDGWSAESSWGKKKTYGTPVEGNPKLVESFEFTLPENHDVFIIVYNVTHGGQTMIESTLNETAFGDTAYLYTYPNDFNLTATLKFKNADCGPCLHITDYGDVIGEYLPENDKSRGAMEIARYLFSSLNRFYTMEIDNGCSADKVQELIKVFETTQDDVWNEFINAYDEANADNEYYADIRQTAYSYIFVNPMLVGIVGDMNNDGVVKASDSLIVQRAAINLADISGKEKLADVNGDGKITAADSLEILRYSINLSKNENIGTEYYEYAVSE